MTVSTTYSARNESIKLGILLSCLCLTLIYGDWVWRWDRLIYDAQSSLIRHDASDDIVIIAIDEASLSSIGRWPWPRNIHADLVDKLTHYQAKAVMIDVIFSEPSHNSQSDQLLSQAIQKNGKVVLPVLLEQTRLQGQLLETLPIPLLTKVAADIGHVHIELDADGIARGTYLYEGLGEARWPHIGVSVLKMLNEIEITTTAQQKSSNTTNSPWTWMRQHPFLIPFIGPPGSFKTTSYINVLNDQVLPETLKDKIVLVGVTAAGLGDSLPTPVSGLARAMPGIEINANIIQAIKSNTLIHTISSSWHYLIAGALVMLPILLFPYLSPRLTLILVISEILLIFLSTLFILHWLYIWIPLSPTLICLVLAYPLWAWRRLEFTVKYLNTELETLSREAKEIERYVVQDNALSFESLQKLIPVIGISVFSMNHKIILNIGDGCTSCTGKLLQDTWTPLTDTVYARYVSINSNMHRLCVRWHNKHHPDEKQSKILKTYIRQGIKPLAEQPKTTVEAIESRIRDIQTTTDKLAYLRQFITDSLEQMADGVIVIDSLGTVTLANRQAIRQIGNSTNTPLLHQPIQPILDTLTLNTGESWDSITNTLLTEKFYENLQVRTSKNKDLVINVSPLYKSNGSIAGFIINLSDITEIKNEQRKRNEMLSFLSHDLRSPLVSILAMLEQSKILNQENKFSDRIEKNIHHTIKLAEDFVHLSHVESNDDIAFSNINLSDVIANAIDTIWDQANARKIKIEQDFMTEGWVSGNGAILERVIINLLTNAIKYSNEHCAVIITLKNNQSNIICCVQDNGPGISEESIPYLFDRFERAQQTGRKHSTTQGIGLGLAFVHAAIERHGGSITVNSKLGEGTGFCILLPAALETDQ